MLIAAVADIHGNLPAFEAVLDHISRQHVDHIVIVGDIVLGAPDDAACWNLARKLNCPIVRGNTDRFVAQYGTPEADPKWNTEQFAPLRWAVQQFSDEERRAIGDLPLTYRIPEISDLLFFHANPYNDLDDIKAYTLESQLREMFNGISGRFFVRGHNHVPQVRLWDERVIVNCGSIGLPIEGNTSAYYLLLEQHRGGWHIHHQSVVYDIDVALHRFYETGYLEAAGPMGRLFMRHVATATEQIVPFLKYYKRWSSESDITLSEAVDRFLSLY